MLWKKLFSLAFFLLLVLSPCTGICSGDEEKPTLSKDSRKLFIDTDMGLDDVRSLFALLNEPGMDILGIITVEGSASIGRGTDNLIGLMESIDRDSTPIYKGYSSAGLKAPPWRSTANQLGGVPFPPPRKLSPMSDPFETIYTIIKESEEPIHYLALGPLSNLSLLESRYPGILAKLRAIWIPVKIKKNGQVEGWNLDYDKPSANKILNAAINVVLIDISDAQAIDGCHFLSSLKGHSAAARWIESLTSDLCPGKGHIIISDELASVILINPDLADFADEHFLAQSKNDALFKIVPGENGNIRVTGLRNPRKGLDLLKNLWEKPMKEKHDHQSSLPAKTLLKKFHGHLGPYVVLGYRMGKLALKVLASEGHFDISAEVYSPLKPPRSCLIDGLQLGSGCTLGKANITVHEFNGPAYATFKTKDGKVVTIRLRSEIPELVGQLIDEKGVEIAGKDLLEREIESLFEFEWKQKNRK